MKRLMILLKAVRDFLVALVRRKDPVEGLSINGFTNLIGWPGNPEESLLREMEEERRTVRPTPKTALFCYQGPTAGKTLFLAKSLETLGCDSLDDQVITPQNADTRIRYRLFINGTTRLVAEPGAVFELNGKDEHQATLFDFDELAMLGNRFLVMDLSSQGTQGVTK